MNETAYKEWRKYLQAQFDCYENASNNMPCDDGRICDACHDEKIFETFWGTYPFYRGIRHDT